VCLVRGRSVKSWRTINLKTAKALGLDVRRRCALALTT